jgi:hypothetical protein
MKRSPGSSSTSGANEPESRSGRTPTPVMARHHWSIDALVRADEDSMFVRADRLVDAVLDDTVEITSDDPPCTRRGRIAARQDDPTRGDFFVVELDPPQ